MVLKIILIIYRECGYLFCFFYFLLFVWYNFLLMWNSFLCLVYLVWKEEKSLLMNRYVFFGLIDMNCGLKLMILMLISRNIFLGCFLVW